MKSPSASEVPGVAAAVASRDVELARFAGTVVDAARHTWGDAIIAEGNGRFNPRELYTETHYALAAVLLFLQGGDRVLLNVAESRLRIWATGTYPLTFFNAMAICLTAIVFRRSGAVHAGLDGTLDDLLTRTREHRAVAYQQWCGNNAYLQQVAVDTVLLPVARGQAVTKQGLALLLREFARFRTDEGLFFDLPRTVGQRERLLPPTYVMKMLFLLGVCDQLHSAPEIERMFRSGMDAMLPLLTRTGTFSYFGRTDNSPFATGLTIFNLRKAAQLSPSRGWQFQEACQRAERFFATFPRTSSGVLEANRFRDAANGTEARLSKDAYAYVAQYSLSACAYALLGAHWFPAPGEVPLTATPRASSAASRDLGVVRIDDGDQELVVRTRSDITAWDRRYLGPTVLRYSVGDRLLVGAIPRAVSTDREARPEVPGGRMRRIVRRLVDSYRHGAEQLDATSVGYVPVLRRGPIDHVPYTPLWLETTPSRVRSRHQMARVRARGAHQCLLEAVQIAHALLPGLRPKEYVRPKMEATPAFVLSRDIVLGREACQIHDTITGDLDGMDCLFSVRQLPGVTVRVEGMTKQGSITGWGSDGRHSLDLYSVRTAGSSISYRCEIMEAS